MLQSDLDIDLVFILSPSELHVSQSLLSLQHSKHLFIEKPLANTLSELDILSKAAGESGKVVFVGYMRRYAPAIQLVKDRLKGKKIQYVRVRELIGPVRHEFPNSQVYNFTSHIPHYA